MEVKCVEKWLTERQSLIVAFSNLNQIRPYPKEPNVFLNHHLEEFCEHLVDYLCLGHFEMYTILMQEIESCVNAQIRIHPTLLDKLLLSTEQAREFDRAYENPENYQDLEADLSWLGENLANRFEWEDELIRAYMEAAAWRVETMPAKSA